MIALLWGAAASAVTGDLCVAVDVNYADLAGDRWIDNGIDRPARGVEVKVVDTRTRTFWLSESEGCLRNLAGGQEVQSPNAPMQGCNGSHKRDPGEPLFAQHEYGKLTKEFVSVALKEGWADFVAAHTWNDPATAGCDSQGSNELDWDLDGTTDLGMGWRASHPTAYRTVDGVDVDIDDLAGTIDCEGDPDVEGVTNPAYAWPPPGTGTIDGRNWLADLEAANDSSGCVAHSNGVKEGNRTTIFDVVRLYWALRTDQGVPANELSDLAVDTCFRTWLADDGNVTSSADQRLPFVRLILSSVHNQVDDELDAEADHVAH